MTDPFHVASAEEIRAGEVAAASFLRDREILEAERFDPRVVAEVRAEALPRDWSWAVLAGLDEAVNLLEGKPVEVEAVDEGSLFYPEEPILVVSGAYLSFGSLETALLGLLCQASGVATMAARCKLAAEGRPVYSFGAGRMHPAIVPMIDRSAFVGGCDGVTAVRGAKEVGLEPLGTLTHSAIVILGEERAWLAADRVLDKRIPRVVLVDTMQDERFGSLAAARVLQDRLAAVRLDTPASRVGNLPQLLREVRWELDARGFGRVRIILSGEIDESSILELNRYADAYGVETAIASAPVIDFALDIVEVEGRPRARRGKLSGRKHLWGCPECGNRGIAPRAARLGHCPRCGHRVRSMLGTWLSEGRRRRKSPAAAEVREHCMKEVRAAPDPFGPRH